MDSNNNEIGDMMEKMDEMACYGGVFSEENIIQVILFCNMIHCTLYYTHPLRTRAALILIGWKSREHNLLSRIPAYWTILNNENCIESTRIC